MAAMVSQANTVAGATSPWSGFRTGLWQKEINVRDFIQQNYAPYEGDASFLKPATARTEHIWDILKRLFVEERRKGVLDPLRFPARSPPILPVTSTRTTRSSSGFRPMRRSSGRSCPTAACAWSSTR
jgi:pyruvate-formate lyase